jgi:putative ABC transport system permease protein
MESLFGIPIGQLSAILTVFFLLGTAIIAFLAMRNRVMFKMAIRNIPRRRAQSTLIVVGLMLATLLFSASFATGDTIAHSFRLEILSVVGQVDEVVRSESVDTAGRRDFFEYSEYERIRDGLVSAPVDGVMPAVKFAVPVIAPSTNLSEPVVEISGLDPTLMQGFDFLEAVDSGRELDIASLGASDIYLSERVADAINVSTGAKINLFFGVIPTVVEVKGIYSDGGNASDAASAFMQMSALQGLVNEPGRINRVFVSNNGDLIKGAVHSDAVMEVLEPLVEDTLLEAEAIKADFLRQADLAGSAFTSIFVLFGSFSIIAGILLIALIFVMLAAERKRELGIARAVGAQREHIVRLFIFEGAVYSLMAAAVGSALGVAVGFVMVRVIAGVFGTFDVDIVFSFRIQSMVIAYTLGMSVTFLVVLVSAGRVSSLNIVRAVRDLPEPPGHQVEVRQRLREVGGAYKRTSGSLARLRPHIAVKVFVFGTVGAWMRLGWSLFRAGYLMILFGLALVQMGIGGEQLAVFMIGVSMVLIGVPLALLHLGRLPERAAFTSAGVLVVAVWMLPSSALEALGLPDFQAGIEMFVLSGVMLVIGAVWVVIYNSDYLVTFGVFVFGRGETLRPIMRTAMAFPLASKFRTGMTLAMFSLVVFTLIVMSVIIGAIGAAFDDTRGFSGGWDVTATVSPANPVDDFIGKLASVDGLDIAQIEAIGSQSGIGTKMVQVGIDDAEPMGAPLTSVDSNFGSTVTYGFALKDSRYETDRDVWEALNNEPDTVVVASLVVPARSDFGVVIGGDFFQLTGFYRDDEELPETYIEVFDRTEQKSMRLRVIGVLDESAPPQFVGLVITGTESLATLQAMPPLQFQIRLHDPLNSIDVARALESAFVTNGMQTEALSEIIEEQRAINLALNRLIQGFMSLGIVVGVAALGVIAARSVVERRALIGMLRAIGYQRAMVQLTFLIESSFIALLGIVIGMALGFGLSVMIVSEIAQDIDGVEYRVPWGSALVVFVVTYGASLLTTFLPAKQAADIYPAEALRLGE